MNTATTTITFNEGYFARRTALDWLFAVLTVAGGLYAFFAYQHAMDGYEKGILLLTIPSVVALG
ncbi:MAG: c-type cytochrome biogenesis protein CcsB, partial [Hylemonella sp.]